MKKLRAIAALFVMTALAGMTLGIVILALAREALIALRDTTGTALPTIVPFVRTEFILTSGIMIVMFIAAFFSNARHRHEVALSSRAVRRMPKARQVPQPH